MNDKTDVKPCPFCGAIPSIETYYENNSLNRKHRYFYVICVNEKCLMHVRTLIYYKLRSSAIYAWNRRDKKKKGQPLYNKEEALHGEK